MDVEQHCWFLCGICVLKWEDGVLWERRGYGSPWHLIPPEPCTSLACKKCRRLTEADLEMVTLEQAQEYALSKGLYGTSTYQMSHMR